MEAYSRLDEVSKQLEFLYEMRTVVEENAKCYQQALEKNREITIKEVTFIVTTLLIFDMVFVVDCLLV